MSKWKEILGSVAPTIATALGGPLAGAATKYLKDKVLGNEDATDSELSDYMLAANPEKLAEIKRIDNEFELEIQRMGVENLKSARASGDKIGHWPQIILGFATISAFFYLLYVMLTNQLDVDPTAEKFLYMLLGSLMTFASMVFRYFFGGNQSDDKNIEKIYNSIPK